MDQYVLLILVFLVIALVLFSMNNKSSWMGGDPQALTLEDFAKQCSEDVQYKTIISQDFPVRVAAPIGLNVKLDNNSGKKVLNINDREVWFKKVNPLNSTYMSDIVIYFEQGSLKLAVRDSAGKQPVIIGTLVPWSKYYMFDVFPKTFVGKLKRFFGVDDATTF